MSQGIQRTIAIVGAGFSGTALAVQLIRRAAGRPLEIVLIERGPDFGRGVAYARQEYPHLLNVPAARMAATTDDPDAFLRFAARRDPQAGADDFLPRTLYGDYLQELLDDAPSGSAGATRLRRLHAEAVAVSIAAGRRPVVIKLADGTQVNADRMVLASGHPGPRLPPGIPCDLIPPVMRPDPWTEGRRLSGRGPIVILGTGLTMADVVCEAVSRHPDVEIHAVSRHGLLPPAQTAFHADAPASDPGTLTQCSGSIRRLVAAVRALAAQAENLGGDWRAVITLVRRSIPTLWPALAPDERRRFLRHVRSYWDIHRHRLPGSVAARLGQLRRSGQLVVHAGRVLSLDSAGTGARVTWRPRGINRLNKLDAAEVVSCAGPEYDVTRANDQLWKSLLDQGLVAPDELRLGIRTQRGALLDRASRASEYLFYLGPLLRADYWEATAVAELRAHAEKLAHRLLYELVPSVS